jgi:hypothetical protein
MALQLNYLRAQRCVSSPFLVPRAPARLSCCHLVKASSAQAEPTIAVTFITGEDQQPIELQCPSGEQLRAFMLDSKVGAGWLQAAQQPPACSKPLTLLQLHGMKEMDLVKYHISGYVSRTLALFNAPHHALCAARCSLLYHRPVHHLGQNLAVRRCWAVRNLYCKRTTG